jgi:hypothetical protein
MYCNIVTTDNHEVGWYGTLFPPEARAKPNVPKHSQNYFGVLIELRAFVSLSTYKYYVNVIDLYGS